MRILHNLLGNTDERTVCPGLAFLPLPAGHTLDLLHPTPRRARVIAKTLDTPTFHSFGQVTNRARDDAHNVPQKRVVGRMMNVGLHHRGVDPQLATVLQTKINSRSHDKVVDSSDGIRPKPVEVAIERMVPGYRRTIKIRELAQRHAIRDAFTNSRYIAAWVGQAGDKAEADRIPHHSNDRDGGRQLLEKLHPAVRDGKNHVWLRAKHLTCQLHRRSLDRNRSTIRLRPSTYPSRRSSRKNAR